MNISRTTPKAAMAPKAPAENAKSKITISLPEVNTETAITTGWDVVDGIGEAAARTGYALGEGLMGGIPVVGILRSQYLRGQHAEGDIKSNSVNQLSNIGVSMAQIGGLGLAGLSALSGITGIGPAVGLIKASGISFAAAAVAGMTTGYATPRD